MTQFPTPPPCSATSFLSSTSTFRLSRALNSGLIIFSFLASASPALLPGRLLPSAPIVAPELLGLSGDLPLSAGLRCRTVGLGKLLRLSTASTVRWKRRNSACARRRVEGRSIVLESSLTKLPSAISISSIRKHGPYHISKPHRNASDAP